MTQLTSPNWDIKTMVEHLNQDSKVAIEIEILEFHQALEMAHKCLLHDPTTRAKLEMVTCHLLDSFKDNKMAKCHQGNHQRTNIVMSEKVMKDHQLIQEVLMFTPTKTRYSTLNSNLKHQATRKMPQQTFLLDLN